MVYIIAFLLVNALSPSGPFSFPYPDFLTHQNGNDAFDHAGLLMNIIPQTRRSATALHCSSLSHQTVAESQYSLLLARAIDSSIFFDEIILATGPNTSS